jgi:hypothetical protein
LNFSQLHRPHILEYAAGFAEVVITSTAHVQCVPVAALQTIRYPLNGGTVGLMHLSSGYAGLVGDGILHFLGLLGAGVIDNYVPPPGGAQLLCNVCNLPRPSDIGLCRAVNGATVSDTPKSVFVTITDQVQANGVPPAARSLAISPTTHLYGFDYHLTGAVCYDGSVFFRVPIKRGYNVFCQGDVASAQWGMIQKDGRMSVIQGATAHLAMRACVLCYTSERRVSWAAGRHKTFNEFHA